MAKPVQTLEEVVKVRVVFDLLKSVVHNGFPVVGDSADGDHRVVKGLIIRSHLTILMKERKFQDSLSSKTPPLLDQLQLITSIKSLIPSLDDLDLSDDDMEKFIDLRPYMNRSPHLVLEDFPLQRVFKLFRGLGLRHIVVVTKHKEVVGIITRQDLLLEFIEAIKNPDFNR